MKKSFLLLFLVLISVWSPVSTSAQSMPEDRLVFCNVTQSEVESNIDNRCDWNDLIRLVNVVIGFLFQLALAIGVVVLLITGVKYLFAGSADSKKIAKESFTKLAIGFLLILGSYLIVNSLFNIAGLDTRWRFLSSNQPSSPSLVVVNQYLE
jgi:hypothetical protein